MNWTGFNFGDAWPYLAAGYGLFFVCIGFGFAAIWWQHRRIKRQEAILETLKKGNH